MGFEYIRAHYGVPIKRGMGVKAYGSYGRIVGARGAYLRIRIDGQKIIENYHPVDGIEYIDEVKNDNQI